MTDPYYDCVCRYLTFTGLTFSKALEHLISYVKEHNDHIPNDEGVINYKLDEDGEWIVSLIYDYTHDVKWKDIVKND